MLRLLGIVIAAATLSSASPAAAALPVTGPIDGQLVRAWYEEGSPTPRLGLPVVLDAGPGSPQLRASTSPATDATGLLGSDLGTADTQEYGEDLLLASLSGPAPLGTVYWQVASGSERTPVHHLELVDGPLAPPASPVAKRQELSPLGYRGIRVGMTLRKARAVSHLRLGTVTRFNEVCSYASQGPAQIQVMLLRGKVARLDLPSAGALTTLGGIRRGDDVSKVLSVFGARSVVTTPHTYVPGGFYWDVRFSSGPYKGRAIRFESDRDGVILTAYAGRPSATAYVEGCA